MDFIEVNQETPNSLSKDHPASEHDFPPSLVTEEKEYATAVATETSKLLKQRIPPPLRRLLYWENPLTSASVLSSLLLFQFSLLFYSVISVLAYSGLFALFASLGLKVYSHFMGNTGTHESLLRKYSDEDWSISQERTEAVSQAILDKINCYAIYVRDLFLLNNYFETVKFAILLYCLTYIGAWFNFLTLCILGTIISFSFPKVYDLFKKEIDHGLYLAKTAIVAKWSLLSKKLVDLPVIGAMLQHKND